MLIGSRSTGTRAQGRKHSLWMGSPLRTSRRRTAGFSAAWRFCETPFHTEAATRFSSLSASSLHAVQCQEGCRQTSADPLDTSEGNTLRARVVWTIRWQKERQSCADFARSAVDVTRGRRREVGASDTASTRPQERPTRRAETRPRRAQHSVPVLEIVELRASRSLLRPTKSFREGLRLRG
jgi:hypothetical protein